MKNTIVKVLLFVSLTLFTKVSIAQLNFKEIQIFKNNYFAQLDKTSLPNNGRTNEKK